jgi:hypothetical protein
MSGKGINMNLISALALAVPLASAVASGINQVLRQAIGKPSKGLLIFSSVLNVLALNLDKAAQLVGMLKK